MSDFLIPRAPQAGLTRRFSGNRRCACLLVSALTASPLDATQLRCCVPHGLHSARRGSGPRGQPALARALEPVEKVVTQSGVWGLKSFVQAGSSTPWRWASGRKTTGRIVHVMRVPAWVIVTVQGSQRSRAVLVSMRPS